MSQPSPWILLIGGGSLLNVGVMVGGLHGPAWARYGGMLVCFAMGVTSIAIALTRYFQKKPERPKIQLKKRPPVELAPETRARASREGGKKRRGGGAAP